MMGKNPSISKCSNRTRGNSFKLKKRADLDQM